MPISARAGNLVYMFARLRPKLAAQHPSIPAGTWYPVRPSNPMALCTEPEPGSIWVDVDGRLRKLPAHYFELTVATAVVA
jgi:hypothetical protein